MLVIIWLITRVTDKCIVLLVGKRFDIWYIQIAFNDRVES